METERILLRPWQESDAEALYKYASDPDIGPRAGWPAHKSVEESRKIIRTFFHNDTTWAIVLKETNRLLHPRKQQHSYRRKRLRGGLLGRKALLEQGNLH